MRARTPSFLFPVLRGRLRSNTFEAAPTHSLTAAIPRPPSQSRRARSAIHTPRRDPSQSTVHIGTTYELLCLHTLRRLGFSLTRTGGKSDKGIDLLGTWAPPLRAPDFASTASSDDNDDALGSSSLPARSSNSPLRVVVQCKAYAGQVYPAQIRELDGAVAGAPGEWRSEETVGVLCAPKGATGGVREALRAAERGVVWITVEEVEGKEGEGVGEGRGRITQLLWNEQVRKAVAKGLGAGVRHVLGLKGVEQEVVLMLDGRIWEPPVIMEGEENNAL